MKFVIRIVLLLILCFCLQRNYSWSQGKTEFLLSELAKAEARSNDIEIADICNKLAFEYWSDSQYQGAILYFKRSLTINIQNNNRNAIANLNNYLGLIYSDLNQHQVALDHLNTALALRRSLQDKKNIFAELLNLATVYRQINDYSQAVELLNSALELAREMNDLQSLRRCYGMLSENYESLGNAEKSFECFNLFSVLDKEIKKIEQQKLETEARQRINQAEQKTREALSQKQEKEFQLIKKEEELHREIQISHARQLEIELLNKENQIKELIVSEQQATLSNERIIRNSIIFGLVLSMAMGGALYIAYTQKRKTNLLLAKRNREISEQKDRIEQQQLKIAEAYVEIKDQNQKINSSIAYAQKIQQAMLSHWDHIYTLIPESFVFYRPRDVISGDFYYFNEWKSDSPKYIIAAVDCTGHGVPGAFMSMIGIKLLYEIIELKNVVSPEKILEALHFEIRKALKQESSSTKDGMDISLVVYDPVMKTIEYSGARNPLVYIKNGILCEVSADRQSIGGIPDLDIKTFTKTTIQIDGPTTFYLFTDGFQDQFGGENGDKFLHRNFSSMLQDIHDSPMKEQEKMLETQLHRWKLNYPQVDDILVIGFRI